MILSKVKYTSEFHRTTKLIENCNTYKASELRNFLFYSGFILLKEFLPDEYYRHYCSYVLAMRIMTRVKWLFLLNSKASFLIDLT